MKKEQNSELKVINYLKRNNGSEHIVEHVGFHESGDYLLRMLFDKGKPFRQHKWEVEKDYNVIEKAEVNKLEKQTCGRRMTEMGPWDYEEHLDHWKVFPNGDRTCSFCGSLHPDDVIKKIKEHGFGVIGGTTKSYKLYVGANSAISTNDPHGRKYYRQHDTDEFIVQWNKLLRESRK